ncbi:MAG: PAS domain S-box protein [Candidatus Pacebacteria bacterium]|nr:PAS domain S-box protein [Candidatus Paceibacterota bacterium]MDD4875060.1 PAS domain S-box protein [Candidatus Paceibacterota bacterium]
MEIDSAANKERRAEEKYKMCCHDFRGVVYGSPIPQFVIGADHKVIYWNNALAKYSGIDEKEVVGTNGQWKAFYDQERPCLADILVDQKIELIPEFYEGKYTKSKLVADAYEAVDYFPGMKKWLFFTAAVMRDDSGEIIGAVETLEDITERKEAENRLKTKTEKLQKNEEKLIDAIKKLGEEKAKDDAILMSIGDGLVITDNSGGVLMMNNAFEKMIGWRADEITGRSLTEIMPCRDEKGDLVPYEKRFICRVIEGEETGTAVFYYTRKDGTCFPGAVTVASIDFGGEKLGAVSVIRDVTKEIELDRAKSEFISLASHQLRDAPTAIRWSTEALLSGIAGELGAKQREYIEEISRCNKSAIGLINDLLNVSRLDLGTFIVDTKKISLVEICESELKQFETLIKDKSLEIAKNFSSDVSEIEADPQLVQIIFQNLISNAIYYTPAKGRISLALSLSDADTALFSITDTGLGIPEEQKPKIFGRMFRASNAKKARAGGSGLGLYVIKQITAQVGWSIGFKSKENEGTTFYVEIPLSGMPKRDGQTKLTKGLA